MKPDEITRQQPFDQMFANWKIPPEIAGWKWSMQGEANCACFSSLLESIAEQLGQQHEVIIVNPDQGPSFSCLRNGIREQLVDSLVCLPRAIIENHP